MVCEIFKIFHKSGDKYKEGKSALSILLNQARYSSRFADSCTFGEILAYTYCFTTMSKTQSFWI